MKITLMAISSLIFIFLIFAVIQNDIEHSEWMKKHCHKIGEMSGNFAPGISASGKMVMTFQSGKTGYQCDDGMQYWE